MKLLPRALPLAVIVLVIIFGSALVRLYTDWLWFQEIGYTELFTVPLAARLLVGFGVGITAFALLYLNAAIAAKGPGSGRASFKFVEGNLRLDASKYTKPLAVLLMAVLSFFTGVAAAANWEVVLRYLNRTPFGSTDPVFGRDISHYFFSLPLVQMALGFATWIILVALTVAAILYFSKGAIGRTARFFSIERKAHTHLGVLIAIWFLLSTLKIIYVKIPNLLYSQTGPFVGASFADLHAYLPFLKILAGIAALTALAALVSIVKKKVLIGAGAIALYIVVAIIGRIYPLVIQKFIVAPNELVKETPSIERNIAATQAAFNLSAIEIRDLTGETSLTKDDLERNQSTVNNIRLWDREPLLDTFGQLQEIRTYYDFVSVDNDRYEINGQYRQVLLSARELNVKSLPTDNFINRHLTFTHGYGITLSPVNEVTPEGLPLLFIKDIPPFTDVKELQIARPAIYYGELSHEPVFVRTSSQEFDYPSGDENVSAEYEGTGGVPIRNIGRKALFALRFGSLKMLLSSDIKPESRVMYYRNIRERVARALPFLSLDHDPYLVINDSGGLVWIQDAYTVSNQYPYAERMKDVFSSNNFAQLNYLRNSVKIAVDAYNGSMQFYIADPNDPLIQTYAKIFPASFKALDEMPKDLRAHLRYPEDLFSYQTELYRTYHMNEPQIFYNKEDEWQIPSYGRSGDPMVRHLIMKLPGEEREEFILMLPFTPRGKDNLAAWMVARSDGEQYGKLVAYRFPKQKLVFGPTQIVNRINQDAEISRQISLWDQRGSEVIYGNLLVIPIEESLLYVQPLYLRAQGGRIPELKRVIVAYENQIAMEETLAGALAQIFRGVRTAPALTKIPGPSGPTGATDLPAQFLRQAQTRYRDALEAQRRGDWAKYGEEIKQLGEILKRLNN